MATQMFLTRAAGFPWGLCRTFPNPNNKADGTSTYWYARGYLLTTRGAGVENSPNSLATVNGPTNGLEFGYSSAGPSEWTSTPLAAAATISGSITFNIRALETNMSANCSAQVIVERLDNIGQIISTVINSSRNVEMGTSEAAQNWSATPTSTSFNKGDRIRVRVLINDAVEGSTNMATGFSATLFYNGTTAAASGDSYVTFNENLTFVSLAPTGSQLFLTSVAGPAVGADVEKEMWTSRGAASVDSITNTTAGPVVPFQATDSAGGSNIEWYSKRLNAFTLADSVLFVLSITGDAGTNTCSRTELAVVNNDGSGAAVYGTTSFPLDWASGQSSHQGIIAGQDIAVTDGQRLRLRVLLEDHEAFAMAAAKTVTLRYDGPTPAANGDSYITLSQSVTEFTPAAAAVLTQGFVDFNDPGVL